MASVLYKVDAFPSQSDLQSITAQILNIEQFEDAQEEIIAVGKNLPHFQHDEISAWLNDQAIDYYHNPKLLQNAPLGTLCGLVTALSVVMRRPRLRNQIHPEFKNALLKRFRAFMH